MLIAAGGIFIFMAMVLRISAENHLRPHKSGLPVMYDLELRVCCVVGFLGIVLLAMHYVLKML